jgi:hypothetical protein
MCQSSLSRWFKSMPCLKAVINLVPYIQHIFPT